MLAMEFLRNPEKAAVKPIYAVFGEDAYFQGETTSAIVRKALEGDADEFSSTRFPGDSTSLASVLDEVRTLPFLAKRRVAIVTDADPFVTAHRRELEAYAEKPSSSGVLVLSVKAWPSTTKLAKLVEKVGLAVDCKKPGEKELPGWLVRLAKTRSNATLTDDAAVLLVELVGPEIGLLASEVEKLATYVGARARITRDDVIAMVDAGRVQKIWAAIDAATMGSGEQALVALDRLLAAREPEQKIMGAVTAALLKTHHAGMLRQARRDVREACREAGIPPFGVESTTKQHAHLGPDRVGRLPAMLLRADLDLKGGSQLSPRAVLERLFVELAGPRRD